MTRSDSTWLSLRAGLGDLFLQEHHRAYSIFNDFTHPTQQTPQMIALIGQQTKSVVMRQLRLGSQEAASGEVHLQADPDGFDEESPRLFADCEMHNVSAPSKSGPERCPGDIIRRPMTWHREVPQALDHPTLAHLLYSKLLAPFSTVICFFAEDLGGLTLVAELLAVWLMGLSSRPSDLPPGTYPRVLILTQRDDLSIFDEQKATKNFMLELGREAEKRHGILGGRNHRRLKKAELDQLLAAQFSGMRVVAFPAMNSPPRSWKALRLRILDDSSELHSRRQQAQIAFSANHFKAFFHLASDHFCSDMVSPFNFVRASRLHNPIPMELTSHLSTFIKQVDPLQVLNFAVPVIASALVFNSYPPGMHGMSKHISSPINN
jgi:hypothetical protein